MPHPLASPAVQLNLNIRGMQPSATVAINERSAALMAEGRTIYKLGLGQSPFPVPAHVQNALREHAHEKDYLAVKGLPALRQSIADYLKRTQGLTYSADNVLIGPGTKELMFIMQLTYYGDLVSQVQVGSPMHRKHESLDATCTGCQLHLKVAWGLPQRH